MAPSVQYPINSKKYIFIFLIGLSALYCNGKMIESNDPAISIQANQILYNGEPFTGKIRQEILALNVYTISEYKNGFEDGKFITQTRDGQLLEKRFFIKGEKNGIHRGWHSNGKDKFYAEFKNGKYINERWEWFDNGQVAVFEKYGENGNALTVKKWKRNGEIYTNVVFSKDGASIGLPGSMLCRPIKVEKVKEIQK